MPTYNCWMRAGQLSPEQRKLIAKSLTEAHHDVALAPRYFVQVIFNNLLPGSHYIAGEDAEKGHIWIRADIRSGRTPEQKGRLMTRIASDLCTITGTPRENIWIYISDIPGTSVMEFGHILPEPGQEEAWFANLPRDLQEKLRSMA